MKKLLLSISCAAAMMITVQANAQAKQAAKKAAQGAVRTTKAARATKGTINAATRGAKAQSGVKAAGASLNSASDLLGASGQAAEKAVEGPTCNVTNFGGVNVEAAMKSGVMGAQSCDAELAVGAKYLAGKMGNQAQGVLQGYGIKKAKDASLEQKATAVSAMAKEMSSKLKISFNESMDRIEKICGKCGVFGASVCQKNVLTAARN